MIVVTFWVRKVNLSGITRANRNRTGRTGRGATTVRKFWARSAKWGGGGKMGARRSSVRSRCFFVVSNTRRYFVNFPTADFHQSWPCTTRDTCPIARSREGFSKIWPKTSKFKGSKIEAPCSYTAWETHCRVHRNLITPCRNS